VRRIAAESGGAAAGTELAVDSSLTDTALIAGGTTGIGAEVARLLARAGVRRLVLLGRRGPDTPGVDALCAELTAAGAEPIVLSCDLADRAELDRILDHVGRARVGTVIHSAGTDVAVPVTELTLTDVSRSVAAKVNGALALDEALTDVPLSAFVLFSSIAGVWGGGGGMAAYAAANALLDALSARRRARGLPGMSVAWGPWGEIGMATRNDGLLEHLARAGLRPIATRDGMAALATVLAGPQRSVAVADIEWERFGLGFTFARASPLLQGLCDAW